MSAAPTAERVLDIRDLKLEFRSLRGVVKALDGVTLSLMRGEIVGLVGESGCGKTVTGLSVLGLLPRNQAVVTGGEIYVDGLEVTGLSDDEVRAIRGKKVAMVFQDPLASLNPVFKVGDQIAAVIKLHRRCSRRMARQSVLEVFEQVGLPATDSLYASYPHQLSGGMRQRVCLAMSLSCRAPLLVADEPTTALDVTIQAQILRQLLELRREMGVSVLMVTHNLGVAAQTCDRIAVMYAGTIVEEGSTEQVLTAPAHPYSAALYACLPEGRLVEQLQTIPGSVPDLINPPVGCRFHPRCGLAIEACRSVKPLPRLIGPGHQVACHVSAGSADPAPARKVTR